MYENQSNSNVNHVNYMKTINVVAVAEVLVHYGMVPPWRKHGKGKGKRKDKGRRKGRR